MTLQASPPISLLDVRAELALGATLPFDLDRPDVRRLAAKGSGVLALTDLLGKERGYWGVLHAQLYSPGPSEYRCGYWSSTMGSLDYTSGAPYFNGSTIVAVHSFSFPSAGEGGLSVAFAGGSAIESVPGNPSLKLQIIHPTTFAVLDERTLPRIGSNGWILYWGSTGTVPAFFSPGDYVITIKWA